MAAIVFLTGCQPMEILAPASIEAPDNPISKTHFDFFKTSFLDRYCLECHNFQLAKGGVDLTSLATIAQKPGLLRPGHPDESSLYLTVLEGSMPPKNPLSMDLTNALKNWIQNWPGLLP